MTYEIYITVLGILPFSRTSLPLCCLDSEQLTRTIMSPVTQPKKHICDVCNERFGDRSAQKQHRRDKHTHPLQQQQPPKIHICRTCGQGFSSWIGRRDHLRDIHGQLLPQTEPSSGIVQTKKHICGICQQRFGSKEAQRDHRIGKHLRPHVPQETSQVASAPTAATKEQICGLRLGDFNSKPALRDHRPAKRSQPSQQPETAQTNAGSAIQSKDHICGICHGVFKTSSALGQHRLAKHPEPNASEAIPEAGAPPSVEPVAVLLYRNICFSIFRFGERDAFQTHLSALCHSEQRLKKEGYTLAHASSVQNDGTTRASDTLPCPDKDPFTPKRAAIVLDCEMAGAVDGHNELIQVTMVDLLSGDILQSCLVDPSTTIQDWREEITGINNLTMRNAVAKNQALHGWAAARAELWCFADKDTIIAGHSVYHDLKALHTSHSRVIDTAIITAEAALGKNSKLGKRWGLEALCQELLGIQIRAFAQPGHKSVHDALEDSLATRELVLMFIRKPDQLKRWAKTAKAAFFKGKSKGKASKPAVSGAGSSRQPRYYDVNYSDYTDDEDEEVLRWEDVVDWEIWPKSPPDWD